MKHFLTGVPVTVAHFFSVIQPKIDRLGHATKCKELTNWFRVATTRTGLTASTTTSLNLANFSVSIRVDAKTAIA